MLEVVLSEGEIQQDRNLINSINKKAETVTREDAEREVWGEISSQRN